MPNPPEKTTLQRSGVSANTAATSTDDDMLRQLAFDNAAQANIISIISTGQIILANSAACQLLGFSEKELLTKTRADIFDINDSAFKKMLKQRTAEGKSTAKVTAIKKNGVSFPSEISSAVFLDQSGMENAVTSIADISEKILEQVNIDIEKEKIVADNIDLANAKQKVIDTEKDKVVAHDIIIAKSKQKKIDAEKEKIVADNIDLANAKQKVIDTEKDKVVAHDIIIAKSKQKKIDVEKEKIVADNIDLANAKQKVIDTEKDKAVAHDIIIAKSKQKKIDVEKEKIVADNIDLANAKQKVIDTEKDKVVAHDIIIAESKQKKIDVEKEKIVADNIDLANAKQKVIDTEKDKVVAHDIIIANAKQKKIDAEKEKIVEGNIILAQEKSDTRLEENNAWIKYIAKTSYDVMWDWDIASGAIYVGDSIEELFGYKVQDNTVRFSDFTRLLLPEEKDRVEKKLMKALAFGSKSWDDSYMLKRQDGSIASATSRASIVRDEKGKAIRLIGATQDVSMLEELEKKLEMQISLEEERKYFLAAKLTFDVIWDWNLLTNEVFIGEGFEELFGYNIKNNKGNISDWGKYLHPDDKQAFEKGLHEAITSGAVHWEHAYRFIRADGSIAKIFDRASIIRHPGGKAYRMIGAMQDMSRQKELEGKLDQEIEMKGKLLTEYKESFKLIFNSSPDTLFDVDLNAHKIMVSDAYEKEFGYKVNINMSPVVDWTTHIHPDDKDQVMEDYYRMLASTDTEWKCGYRFLRADNSIANVISNRIILRNPDGKAYRMIGSMQDISKQKVLEEKLDQEIKLKEKQIAEAMEEARETERSDIGKELHDNVNQLLSASRLYLGMAKGGGKDSEMYLSRSSEYTYTAIEEIRKLTKGLTTDTIKNLGLCEAIDNVVRDTMEVHPVKMTCDLENFKEDSVNDKFKLNIFRIVQEQLSNILKHAKATNASITVSQKGKSIVLVVSDDGIGFDTAKKRKGIGVDNIKSRASAYNGTANFVSQPGEGCILTVTFPFSDALS